MAVLVIGGQAKHVGKTTVSAGLIARLPERRWTACKITPCAHRARPNAGPAAITVEREIGFGSDTARYRAAGAARALLVELHAGRLAEAMPRLREEIAAAENMIFESNSLLDFLRPDLCLLVVDRAIGEFKDSARRLLARADAVVVRASTSSIVPQWKGVSPDALKGKPHFRFEPPEWLEEELIAFVEERLNAIAVKR